MRGGVMIVARSLSKMSKIEGQIKQQNMRRFVIQYNQDELDSISPDNIHDWGEYVPNGKEM